MKLLLIEENPQLAHWLTQILRENKFSVDVASDGEMADQVLLTENYDVVLLDLMLPKMSGAQECIAPLARAPQCGAGHDPDCQRLDR